jgi:hypothetical protein
MLPVVAKLPPGETYGVLGRFAGPRELYHACELVRDAGYTRWDAHTPFPVHGLDRAMGLRPSVLPWIVLVMGLAGAAGAFLLQSWVSASDLYVPGVGPGYPLVISGKPLLSWPAFVPITFEVGVLGGALGAVLGMLALNRLPMHHHPLFASRLFERASDDGFFISIESWDPRFDRRRTAEFLREIGAADVELVGAERAA